MSLETEPQTGTTSEVAPSGDGRTAWGIGLAALASALLLAVASAPFLRAQSIWSDEVTQLAGLALPPIEAARWLAGEDPARFGVVPDRMPPLSYWFGWAWAKAFGDSFQSFRWMGVLASAGAAACVAIAAGRLAGWRGALVAGLLFAISPNVVTIAPEVRAYPFLLLFASAAFLCLIGYAQSRREAEARWLAGCLACSLAAIYSHFFGLVLGGAVFASATLVALAGRRRAALPIACGLLMLPLSAGLYPFYKSSSTMSLDERDDPAVQTIASFVRMALRLIGHPSATIDWIPLVMILLGVVGLLAMGLRPRRLDPPDRDDDAIDQNPRPLVPYRLDLLAVPLAVAAGLAVTLLAGFQIRSFFVFRSTYSLWAVPGLFILAGCAFAPSSGRRWTIPAALLAAMAMGGEAWSVGTILSHPETFGHGPANAIERFLASEGEPPPIIVHDHGSCWVFIYYPIFFVHQNGIEQYHRAPEPGDGQARRWKLEPLGGATHPTTLADLPTDRKVLVLYGTQVGHDEIRRELRGGGADLPSGPLIEALERDPDWVAERELRFLGFTSVRGRLYAPRAGKPAASASRRARPSLANEPVFSIESSRNRPSIPPRSPSPLPFHHSNG